MLLQMYYRVRAALARQTPLRMAFARPWPTRRRGFKLWLISGGLGLRGLLYVVNPDSRSQAFQFPYDWVTTWGWGVTLMVICAASAFSSYCHLGRDRYGYVLMTMTTAAWAVSYGYGWLYRGAGDAALQGLVSLGLLAALLYHCAGDPEVAR